ncbi:MAG: hypothetical protein ACTSSM_11220 [Promethearchaeota archaeon]
MYFQSNDISRYLLIFITQPLISILFLYLTYKILNRNRSIHTIILSLFYFTISLGIILNIIYAIAAIFHNINATYIIFYMTTYLLGHSPIYLIVFIKMLLRIEEKPLVKKDLIYVFIYGIIFLFIFFIPNGITIGEETNWRPLYSIDFMIFSYFITTFLIILPLLYFSLKLYRTIKLKSLRKRYRLFIFGTLGFVSTLYGTILYNTWFNPIYRFFWSICGSFFLIITVLFIYFGIGKDL